MADRKPTRRDFPVMWTLAQTRRHHKPPGYYGVCPVCHLAVQNRNRNRHAKACARRKRLAPDLWREWQHDMREPI